MKDEDKIIGPTLPPQFFSTKTNVPESASIGPALPPHMLNKCSSEPPSQEKCSDISNLTYSESSSIIGPALPPHLVKSCSESSCFDKPQSTSSCIGPQLPSLSEKDSDISEPSFFGPQLPLHILNKSTKSSGDIDECDAKTIGPSLAPHLRKMSSEKCSDISNKTHSESSSVIGPALPPRLVKSYSESSCFDEPHSTSSCIEPQLPSFSKNDINISEPSFLGPQLPPHMLNKSRQSSENVEECDTKTIGPSLPPHLRKKLQEKAEEQSHEEPIEEDHETYGPLPAGVSKYSSAQMALEERALQLQIEQLGPQEDNKVVRESWMIDLPEAKAAHFGLGPRQFRNRAGPDMSDRSSWTDIPGEKGKQKNKEEKVDLKAEAELIGIQKRDKEQESLAKKHKRKSKSLVEMHQEKIKKTDETTSSERRPFSREVDLQVNKFDDAQKKAILKKAQLLDDRFSSGKSKYL